MLDTAMKNDDLGDAKVIKTFAQAEHEQDEDPGGHRRKGDTPDTSMRCSRRPSRSRPR